MIRLGIISVGIALAGGGVVYLIYGIAKLFH